MIALKSRLALVFATLVGSALPQSTTQSIQGLVNDSSAAVIAGATITATETGTGVSRTVLTNDTGNYTFPLLPVGNYDMRCERPGFKTEVVKSVRVETAAQVRQNFALEVGSVTETVEVSASAVLLNTENATVGGVIENKRIIELPLNGRNMASLAVLVPGVQFGERTGRADGLGGFPIPGQYPQHTSMRYATLMRILCARNGGVFVGLPEGQAAARRSN